MKKVLTLVAAYGASASLFAAEGAEKVAVVPEASFIYVLRERFIEGGAEFMGVVLACLIFGLALVIERIVYLNLATTNTKKLVSAVDEALAFRWCRRSKRSV